MFSKLSVAFLIILGVSIVAFRVVVYLDYVGLLDNLNYTLVFILTNAGTCIGFGGIVWACAGKRISQNVLSD